MNSHLNYVCIAWGLKDFLNNKCLFSKKKQLRIMNFAPFNAHTTPLFKSGNILKFADIAIVESCSFIIVLIGTLFQPAEPVLSHGENLPL